MIIIQDTQEKNPFDFSFYDVEVKVQKIKTGDYTVEGFEDVILIERKASADEIAGNFSKKKEAWWREMKRISEVEYKYIVCEFPLEHVLEYPKYSMAPRKDIIKANGMLLSKNIDRCIADYGVQVIFCNSKQEAEDKTYNLLKDVYENHKEGWY